MIDNLAIGISHGLLMLTAWLLLRRPDLDNEPGPNDPPAPPADARRGRSARFGKRPRA